MAATIRLTVLTGPHKGTRFCTRGMTACMVGRAPECHMRLCGDTRDQSISRFHCQIVLDPPLVRIQDMHSANGTYVNGDKVGDDPMAAAAVGAARDGDIITIGGTSLQVNILDCAVPIAETSDPRVTGVMADIVKKNCPVDC